MRAAARGAVLPWLGRRRGRRWGSRNLRTSPISRRSIWQRSPGKNHYPHSKVRNVRSTPPAYHPEPVREARSHVFPSGIIERARRATSRKERLTSITRLRDIRSYVAARRTLSTDRLFWISLSLYRVRQSRCRGQSSCQLRQYGLPRVVEGVPIVPRELNRHFVACRCRCRQ